MRIRFRYLVHSGRGLLYTRLPFHRSQRLACASDDTDTARGGCLLSKRTAHKRVPQLGTKIQRRHPWCLALETCADIDTYASKRYPSSVYASGRLLQLPQTSKLAIGQMRAGASFVWTCVTFRVTDLSSIKRSDDMAFNQNHAFQCLAMCPGLVKACAT